ncbi:MAG: EscU/YscU/HrcU family type III secretion system export apparatus switch protein, partial [Pseudomonadota bacterium]
MSQQDNFQEKTEQPTPKRLADARRKGNVARSRELSATAVMLGGSVLLLLAAEPYGRSLIAIMTDSLTLTNVDLGDPGSMLARFGDLGRRALYAGLPLLAAVSVAALLSSIALGGWSFSPSALAFKTERISILKGLKRVFGVRGLVELLKALAKFAVIAAIAVAWLKLIGPRLKGLSFEHPAQALVHAGLLCLQSLL